MAPKGKKAGKGDRASKKIKQQRDSPENKEEEGAPSVTEKELFLQREYKELSENLDMLAKRLTNLHLDNRFLNQESQRVEQENKTYISYILKHTQRCQGAIVTLSDQNKKDLEEVQNEMKPLFSQYKEKEEELQSQLLEKECQLARLVKEIKELQPFKKTQAEQIDRIRKLEREVLRMRVLYSDNVQKVKSKFLQEKAAFENESQKMVQTLSKQAVQQATCSLFEHTRQVQEENKKLSHEVLHLIRRMTILKAYRLKLQEHNKKLLEEVQYSKDLAQIRSRHKIYTSEAGDQMTLQELQHGGDIEHMHHLLKHATFRRSALEEAQQHHQFEGLKCLVCKPQNEVINALSLSKANT